jgi:hypothetical protein
LNLQDLQGQRHGKYRNFHTIKCTVL